MKRWLIEYEDIEHGVTGEIEVEAENREDAREAFWAAHPGVAVRIWEQPEMEMPYDVWNENWEAAQDE